MKEIFMKLLWSFAEECHIEGLNLYHGSSYADMEFECKGKHYKISLMEKDEEEK